MLSFDDQAAAASQPASSQQFAQSSRSETHLRILRRALIPDPGKRRVERAQWSVSRHVTEYWLALLKQTELRGPRIFDLQIAATMIVHGIKKIATYNGKDFQAISEIESFEPQSSTYIQ